MPNDLIPFAAVGAARLNVTCRVAGDLVNGDLPDPVPYDANDADIKAMATEAIANGDIPGIPAAEVDLTEFAVDRFPATDDVAYARLFVRLKTPLGGFNYI